MGACHSTYESNDSRWVRDLAWLKLNCRKQINNGGMNRLDRNTLKSNPKIFSRIKTLYNHGMAFAVSAHAYVSNTIDLATDQYRDIVFAMPDKEFMAMMSNRY